MEYLEFETITLNNDGTFKGRLGFYNDKIEQKALLHKDKTCCFDLDVKKNKNIPIQTQIAFFEDWLASCGFDVNDPFLEDEGVFIVKTRSGGRHYVFANNGTLTSKCLLKIPFDESKKEFIYCDLLCGNSITFLTVPFGEYKIINIPKKLTKISALALAKIFSYTNISKNEKNALELNFHEKIADEDLLAILGECKRVLKTTYSYNLWYEISRFIAFHSKDFKDGLVKFLYLSRTTFGYESEEKARNQYENSYKEVHEKKNVPFYDSLKKHIREEGFNFEDITCEKRILIKEVEENINFLESLRPLANKPPKEKIENNKEVEKKTPLNEENIENNDEEVLLKELNERVNELCFDLMHEKGFFGELATFIYENSSPKIPNFAVFTAFSICGCLLSWDYGFSIHKGKSAGQLNLWTVLINNSSTGKDFYIKFVEHVINAMKHGDMPCCFEASNPTSVNGLEVIYNHYFHKRNVLITYDEYLTKSFLKKESKEAYTNDLKGAMSSLYDGILKPPTSKGSLSIKPIYDCHAHIFGVSVPTFKDFDLTQGIMNRHMFVFPSVKEAEMDFDGERQKIFNEKQNTKGTYNERRKAFTEEFKRKYLSVFLKQKTKNELYKFYNKNGIETSIQDETDILTADKSFKDLESDTKKLLKEEKELLLYEKIWTPSIVEGKSSENYLNDVYTLFTFYLENENKFFYNINDKEFIKEKPRIKSGLRERMAFISAKMACILTISRGENVIKKETFLQTFDLCYITREIHSLNMHDTEIAYTQQEKSFNDVLDKFIEKIEDEKWWKNQVSTQGCLTASKAVNRLKILSPLKGSDLTNLFARVATLHPEKYEIVMEGKNISLRRKTS